MLPALTCESLTCVRPHWNESGLAQVRDFTASFPPGTVTGFHGPDGCGKGLLLNVLGLLEPPDSGRIHIQEHTALGLPAEEARQLRNEAFGFLFDQPCLLPSFSVAENVAMPLFRICGGDAPTARLRTLEVLDFCGIAQHECTLVGRLDPADQRRACLARALVHRPGILIAISPRGAARLIPLLRLAAHQTGLCVLWAGEREELAPHADRLIEMRDGRITEDIHA
jgi:ABC-type lipoprotein export system ATPase subunit